VAKSDSRTVLRLKVTSPSK